MSSSVREDLRLRSRLLRKNVGGGGGTAETSQLIFQLSAAEAKNYEEPCVRMCWWRQLGDQGAERDIDAVLIDTEANARLDKTSATAVVNDKEVTLESRRHALLT